MGNGNYCAFEPNDKAEVTGRDIIMESIRQKCIYKSGTRNYFRYMVGFYEFCVNKFNEECSQTLMNRYGISLYSIKKCVDDSFH